MMAASTSVSSQVTDSHDFESVTSRKSTNTATDRLYIIRSLPIYLLQFCQILSCFKTERIPILLFVRSSKYQARWGSDGELVWETPQARHVPTCVIELFGDIIDDAEVNDKLEVARKLGVLILESFASIFYISLSSEFKDEIHRTLSSDNQQQSIFATLCITIHAYPDEHTSIVWEEIRRQLQKIVVKDCLPILLVISPSDLLKHGAALSKYNEGIFLATALRFLVAVQPQKPELNGLIFGMLKACELHTSQEAQAEVKHSRLILAIRKAILSNSPSHKFDINKFDHLTSIYNKVDIVYHANCEIAYGSFSIPNQSRILNSDTSIFPTSHQNLSLSSIEKIGTAFSLPDTNIITSIDYLLKDLSSDIQALVGFILAKRQLFRIAMVVLENVFKEVEAAYGPKSWELGILAAELTKCCNIVNRQHAGRKWAQYVLSKRFDIGNRPDTLYLKVSLADSLLGTASYSEATAVLQNLLEQLDTTHPLSPPMTLKIMIRLLKANRRTRHNSFPADTIARAVGAADYASPDLQSACLEELSLYTSSIDRYTPRPATIRESSSAGDKELSFGAALKERLRLLVDLPTSPIQRARQQSRIHSAREFTRDKQDSEHVSGSGGRPRLPVENDFKDSLLNFYLTHPIESDVENCIILLHDEGGTEADFDTFFKIPLRQAKTVYISLRGLYNSNIGKNSWTEGRRHWNVHFNLLKSTRILQTMIQDVLVHACRFPPSKILIIGYGLGGTLALMTGIAAFDKCSFNQLTLGGIVSLGADSVGPFSHDTFTLATFPPSISNRGLNCTLQKTYTAALIMTDQGDTSVDSGDWLRTKALFHYVDKELCTDLKMKDTANDKKWQPLLDFYAHVLWREEWTKPATLTFDGGGVRGYGSLLLLQELMTEIGNEEKLVASEDNLNESSFAPCYYKPRDRWALNFPDSEVQRFQIEATPTKIERKPRRIGNLSSSTDERLKNSALFLPCHYFDYIGGIDTGGLIAIMVSRLRMTVSDCLTEFKTIRDEVFGSTPVSDYLIRFETIRDEMLSSLQLSDYLTEHENTDVDVEVLGSKQVSHDLILDNGGKNLYSNKKLAIVFNNISQKYGERISFGNIRYPCPQDLCQTMVLAFLYRDHDSGYIFHTYDNTNTNPDPFRSKKYPDATRNISIYNDESSKPFRPRVYHDPVQNVSIPEILAATFAASGYFVAPIDIAISGSSLRFGNISLGAGGINTDPSKLMFNEILGYENKGAIPSITIGSIGENSKGVSFTPSSSKSVISNETTILGLDFGFLLKDIPYNEWINEDNSTKTSTAKNIEKAIAKYLDNKEVRENLKKVAQLLVKRRRLRTRDKSAWDKYACASYYLCSYGDCQEERLETLNTYQQHLVAIHHLNNYDESTKELVKEARRCWIYRN